MLDVSNGSDQMEKAPEECTRIFKENDVFEYISQCYGILHLSSYDCALHEVEEFLRNRGIYI